MLHVSHLLFKYSSVLIVNIPDLFQSPCSSSPCQNGGTCIPNYDFNSHDCLCAQGFVGEYCEKGNWYVSIPSSLFQRFVSTNFPSEVILFNDSRAQLPENSWSDNHCTCAELVWLFHARTLPAILFASTLAVEKYQFVWYIIKHMIHKKSQFWA